MNARVMSVNALSDAMRRVALQAALSGICLVSPMSVGAQFVSAPLTTTKATASEIPRTVAGNALRAWLAAFNSGDSTQLAAFVRRHDPERSTGELLRFRRSTGTFALLTIERSEARHIAFTMRRERNPTVVYGELDVTGTAPLRVDGPTLQALGPGVGIEALSINAATRHRVVDRVVALLDSLYVLPEVAHRTGDSLRTRFARGAYDGLANGMTFSRRLDSDLRELTRDQHVELLFSASPFPPAPAVGAAPVAPTTAQRERARQEEAERNCAFHRVERLEGNIGYVRFDAFPDVELCAETVAAALTFVAGTRALVVDLRENMGGTPGMVALVASYLFDAPTHLNDLWTRHAETTESFWTRDSVAGRRYGGTKPVYVLTSSRTISAAEEFAYDMQALKRATIVGEQTSGGAHPVRLRRIDDHFAVGIPHARAINPVTRTNWEGVGVSPDVRVSAGDALARVQALLR